MPISRLMSAPINAVLPRFNLVGRRWLRSRAASERFLYVLDMRTINAV